MSDIVLKGDDGSTIVLNAPAETLIVLDGGLRGETGAAGATGPTGATGQGVPTGGTTNQYLKKNSATNYDTSWDSLDKTDVGLANVDNTADANKPVSTAQATAISTAQTNANSYTNTQIAAIDFPVDSVAGKTGAVTLTKADVGLPNVDNTSDANKPVSTATQTALDAKQATLVSGTNIKTINGTTLLGSGDLTITGGGGTAPDATTTTKGIVQLAGDLAGTADAPTVPGLATKEPTITAGTTAQYYRGDKTFQTLDKTAVGLGNVDNISDVDKPVSTATQTALDAKLNLAGGTITGSLLFGTNLTYNLGSTTAYASNLYARTLNLNSTASISGSVAGTSNVTGNLGILATGGSATHSLTLGSTATGIALYNTSDQTTNWERMLMQWSANAAVIGTGKAGTGSVRKLTLHQGGQTTIDINTTGAPFIDMYNAFSTNGSGETFMRVRNTNASTGGVNVTMLIAPNINQTGTAGYTTLLINPTETAVGSGPKFLGDFQVGGVRKASIDNTGAIMVTGFDAALATKTANYTLIVSDYTILFDATAGNLVATLPTAASSTGRVYNIKKTDSTANTVTIAAAGAELIDGASTKVISTQYNSYTIQSTGTGWVVI